MRILVTGSSGHLGEALVRSLSGAGNKVAGLDIKPSPWTGAVGSITDRDFVDRNMKGVDVVIHTATLHKPHVATHSKQAFVDTNITGTLNLLEAAAQNHVKSFVFTSTTSVFGDAMRPAPAAPAVWVNEELPPQPKNIYGVTKLCAEGLCRMFSRNLKLPCIVLRTSRFFPEDDDNRHKRNAFDDDNLKVNELLFRRADIADMVSAHECAATRAPELGFGTFIISATTPFSRGDAALLGRDAREALQRLCPEYRDIYQRLGWRMFASIGRVYDNTHARELLGWQPRFTFEQAIARLAEGDDYRSELARQVGAKGYHNRQFKDGPYPVEDSPVIEAGHDR